MPMISKPLVQAPTSLNENVREELRRRIGCGTYAAGSAIPSTAQLSEEFSVSPITVKRAFRDLQSEGLLTSVPGKGTFVKERRRFLRDLDIWMSSMDNARSLGFEPSMSLISITKETISEPAMGIFDPPRSKMLCVRKIIYADAIPIMFDLTYVTADLPEAVVDQFGERFVMDALRHGGIEIGDTHLVIDAAPASSEAQRIFSVQSGYPMIRRLYRVKTSRPDISIFGLVESPFDRLAVSVTMPAKAPAVGEAE
jgi:DNA-binding GntR family transcriptional regulator